MTMVIQSVFDEGRLSKLQKLKSATGFNTSELLRRLVDAAEVEPMKVNVNLSTNGKGDVNIRQDSHVAFAA